MTSKPADSSSQQALPQGENASLSGPLAGPPEHQGSRTRNQVFKSGPLFISSKGIGWTSWKKRWFILTRTSLVFFRSDPGAAPQKGGEMNLTLGGIDLNNSASVEVKVDKKLLTVFFPDGRDGRAFTLKAETLEDLLEWKTALENALQLAPSATHAAGQNGLPKNELTDAANGSADQQMDKPPSKSMVIGRPILLALEDIDGSPSFLEKALRYIEDHGCKVEGVLRQAADVDDVHHRVREYEQGKTEFSAEEDAHIIGDCIKYILRELPSSPVPATCCNALLEAFRSDRNNRLNAMRTAILETFPEPNRRLLQRILLMMQTVASNQAVNRMSTSAVAACMSPLLLRPLLAGDCELENTHMDVAGDGSFQLLQAAAAANHAQAIIITLLDEYDNIFGEGSMSGAIFSESDESGSGTEEASDDGSYDEDDYDDDDDDDHEYASGDHDEETDDDDDEDDDERSVIETCSESDQDCSESGDHAESDSYDEKASRSSSFSKSSERANNHIAKPKSPSSLPSSPVPRNHSRQGIDNMKKNKDRSVAEVDDTDKSRRDTNIDTSSPNVSGSSTPQSGSQNSSTRLRKSSQARNPKWGRTPAKRNLSMESIDFSLDNEDDEIQRLEDAKTDLQNKIAEEANGNAILQASLERRKKALYERRLALEKDVSRLQEQLQKEKDLRAALESNVSQVPSLAGISEKTKIDLQEIAIAEENFNNLKQRFDDLGSEISREREYNAALLHDRNIQIQDASFRRTMMMNNKDNEMKGTPNHIEKSSRDDGQRNNSMERGDCDNEGNKEPSLSNKNQNQSNDASQADHSKFGGIRNNSQSFESIVAKANLSTARKSSSKGEGSTSALSKLTNRLNFLKERRNQIASELQNLDKGKGSSNQPALSPGKGKAPELPINPNTDKHSSGGSIVQNQDSSTNAMSTEGDNNNDKKKNDNKSSSNSRSDAPSYSSGKGMPNEGDRTEGDNKDYCKRSDKKRSSNSKPDAPSSYNSGKETSNEGDNNDSNRKNDNNKSNEGDNKDGNRKGFSSKSDAPISHSSVKAGSTEGNSNEYNRKSKNRDGNKKGSSSKTDTSSQNLDNSSHLDRLKSEGPSSRSSDKDRQ